MIGLIDSQNGTINDTAVVQRLARAIALSDGEFSLLLACCNADKQEEIISVLKEFSTVDIRKVILSSKGSNALHKYCIGTGFQSARCFGSQGFGVCRSD